VDGVVISVKSEPDNGRGRLPWMRPADLTTPQRALYEAIASGPRSLDANASPLTDDEGRLNAPFNTMLFAPAVGTAFQHVGECLRYEGSLSPLHRELAILTVALHEGSQVEWESHCRPALAAGLADTQLAALAAGREPVGLAAAACFVRRAVDELLWSGDLTDATFQGLSATVGLGQVVELVLLVGYYRALALSLRTFGAPA
jgi:4-carboxymuconolactone decarboxylase